MAADIATGLLSASNPYMAAGSMLKDALGGPSNATSGGTSSSSFDSSGWNVNFGGGSIDSNRSQTPAGVGAVDAYLPYALGAFALLIVWRMTRKG